jgi:hypothetical protein
MNIAVALNRKGELLLLYSRKYRLLHGGIVLIYIKNYYS